MFSVFVSVSLNVLCSEPLQPRIRRSGFTDSRSPIRHTAAGSSLAEGGFQCQGRTAKPLRLAVSRDFFAGLELDVNWAFSGQLDSLV